MRYRRLLFLALFALVALAATGYPLSTTTAQQATTYSGHASAVTVTDAFGELLSRANTGPLPTEGGHLEADAGAVTLLNVQAGPSHAEITGENDQTHAHATVGSVSAASLVSIGTMESTATAQCGRNGPEVSGKAKVSDLKVLGIPIPVTSEPNQIVTIPLVAQLVINAQDIVREGNSASITVTAVRGSIGTVDVNLAESAAGITCP